MQYVGFLIAIVALLGWTAHLFLQSFVRVNDARALDIQVKVNKHIDDTIAGALSRLKPRKEPTEQPRAGTQVVLDDLTEFRNEAARTGSILADMPMME